MSLELWKQVEQSDPRTLKQMGHGAKLTAIDAYAQIKRATELFGPVGLGWGWEPSWMWHEDYVSCQCTIWYKYDGEKNTFDVCGTAPRFTGRDNKTNFDAPKSALTDAITKGLSYLGFNADVFLGKFDGNKYDEGPQRQAHHTDENRQQQRDVSQSIPRNIQGIDNKIHEEKNIHPAHKTAQRIIKEMNECETMDELIMCWEKEQDILSRMPKEISQDVIDTKNKRKQEIASGSQVRY